MNKKISTDKRRKDRKYYVVILLSSILIPLATALLIVYGDSKNSSIAILSIISIVLSFLAIILSIKKLGIKMSSLISSIIKAIPIETLR